MHTETQKKTNSSRPTFEKRAKALADEVRSIGEAILTENRHTAGELSGAVKLVVVELGRAAQKIEASGTAVVAARDRVRVQQHLALLDAHDRLKVLEQLTRTALAGAARSAVFIGETARVKLALARLDATDLATTTRHEVLDGRRHIEARSEDLVRKIEALVTAFKNVGVSLVGGNAAAIGVAEKR